MNHPANQLSQAPLPRNHARGSAFAGMHSPYMDNRPLLVAGKPETRKYKAVFFLGKAEIGLESNFVEATARP